MLEPASIAATPPRGRGVTSYPAAFRYFVSRSRAPRLSSINRMRVSDVLRFMDLTPRRPENRLRPWNGKRAATPKIAIFSIKLTFLAWRRLWMSRDAV